jgi:tight adherence protein B
VRHALYETPWGLVALSVAVSSLVLVASVVAFRVPRKQWIRQRLGLPNETRGQRALQGGPGGVRIQLTALFGATEGALGQARFWLALELLLERANVRLRAVELLYTMLCSGVGLALLAGLFTGSGFASFLAIAIGGVAPYAFVARRAARRKKALEEQLPDVLMSIAGSLQVGHSFQQGMQAVVDKQLAPTSQEFDRVLQETSLGKSLEEALDDLSRRMGSAELRFVLMAVTIQRQVGGSLATLFDTIADTIRERQRFQTKVRALTAMGRASAYVLVAMPFAVAGMLTLVNPGYMRPLYTTGAGHTLILLALVMMSIGSFILKRLVAFKV